MFQSEIDNTAPLVLHCELFRRWQSEGPRFDTEAIDPKDGNSPSAVLSPIVSPRGNHAVHFNFETFDKE